MLYIENLALTMLESWSPGQVLVQKEKLDLETLVIVQIYINIKIHYSACVRHELDI